MKAPQALNKVLLTLAAVALSLLALAAIAGAATKQPSGALQLVGQSAFVPADGTMETILRWTGPENPDLVLRATIWAPIVDEAEVFSEPRVIVHGVTSVPISDIARTPDGDLSFPIAIRSFTANNDERKYLQDAGVYPVTFELRDSSGEIARLRTNLVRLSTDVTEDPLLPVSMILNVSSADGLGLSEAIELLTNHPTQPITILLETGLLSQLESDEALSAAFVEALAQRSVVAGTQRNLDPSALAQIDQPEFYSQALAETRSRFEALGIHLDTTILPLATAITAEGADLLVQAGIETVISTGLAPGSIGSIQTSSGELTVLRVDDDRTARLSVPNPEIQRVDDSLRRAHQLIALLSVRHEQDTSPVLLGGTKLRSADINSLEVVLGSLDLGGVLEGASLQAATNSFRRLSFLPAENPSQNLTDIAAPLAEVQVLLETYSGFRVAGGPSPEGIELQLFDGLSHDLNQQGRVKAIASAKEDLLAEFDVISLPEGPAITLAAQRSAIPLTITNTSSGARQVRLLFQSDRISVEENEQIVIVQPGKSLVEVNIQARSLGVSTLLVTITTPDGTQVLATTKFQIRSTAVPGLGYALSGTALFLLIIWWIRSIRRSRALKKTESQSITEEGSDTPTESRSEASSQDQSGSAT